jgi:hypothetical protein
MKAALKSSRLWVTFVLFASTLTLFQNCGNYKFTQGTPAAADLIGVAGACTQVLQTTTENLRIIFMVDNSGSTLTTDPNRNYRDATIQAFLQNELHLRLRLLRSGCLQLVRHELGQLRKKSFPGHRQQLANGHGS